MGIATKFAKWEVPALATLKSCKAYQLREQLNNGEKLSRADKIGSQRLSTAIATFVVAYR